MKNNVSQESKTNLDFIFMVSHELRAPLAIVKEGVSLVLNQTLGKVNPKQQQVLTTTRRNIDRIDQLIINMLNISRLEAGKMEIKKGSIDAVGMMKELALFFQPRMKEKNLSLKISFSKATMEFWADFRLLHEVFMHLIGNALKFTEKGGIEVFVRSLKDSVECEVKDTGIGISREDLPKVFEKFQPFGWAPGGGEKGMGLGLAIVKGIIELHGGEVSVESQLGQGTSILFAIPAKESVRKK